MRLRRSTSSAEASLGVLLGLGTSYNTRAGIKSTTHVKGKHRITVSDKHAKAKAFPRYIVQMYRYGVRHTWYSATYNTICSAF